MTTDNLLSEVSGGIGIATLNRPHVLNVIDLDLIDALYQQLKAWEHDPEVRAVMVRGSGSRAFCAGGDVRAVWQMRGDDAFMDAVYRREYILDDYINRYPKPYIALMAGIVMGGGCGISVHGRHRVVTDTTMLAMPECKIGLFPDIAGSHFLSRCPDEYGLLMGLTGLRVNGADAIRLGLADYYVPAARLDELVEALSRTVLVEETLNAFEGDLPPSALSAPASAVKASFGRSSVVEILHSLKADSADWAKQALLSMEAACPFSLELTFRAIREGAKKSMRDCLITDFRIAQRIMRKGDYFEGVRALIVDKDNQPRWNPALLADVGKDEIDACFAPLEEDLKFA